MEIFSPDWTAFPTMTLKTWWELIEKELKGKPIDSLDWEIAPGWTGKPVYHEPGKDYGGPLLAGRSSADWHILETIQSGQNPEAARTIAIQSLSEGAQGIIYTNVNPLDVPTLTKGIWMDMVPVYWKLSPGSDPGLFLSQLTNSISSLRQGLDQELQGGWLLPSDPEEHRQLRLAFPRWASVVASVGPLKDPVREIRHLMQEVRTWLDHEKGGPDLVNELIVHMEIGHAYLPEIARIRAWRMIWGHLMVSYGLPVNTPCRIQATISPDPELPWETTYIAATTRALSAILGGIDQLSILPPAIEQTPFAHRIAHNIQHLMKEEAHLHRVVDPLAGSYAIEELTLHLAKTCWEQE
ncbi:MAG: hypothetical protein K9I85_04420 [Saprospiraceae bacterium]|nr:hypothetical protein [Saprospiraceae bacterium]